MKLEEVILRDTRSAQPLATVVPIGTLYYVTDESVLERSNGTIWESYSDTAIVIGGITQLTGAVTAGPGSGSQAATLANDAVTTVKILDANVTTAKIADTNVTTGKIADDAVTYAKMQNVSGVCLLGGDAAGNVEEITIGTGLALAAGELTASGGSGSDWDVEIVKSADQDVTNSNTVIDDTELQFAVTAGSVWQIMMIVIYSSSVATNDFKCGFAVAAGTAYGPISGLGPNSADSAQNTINVMNGAASGTFVFGTDSSGLGTTRAVKIDAVFKITNTTTLKFQFAQGTAGVGQSSRCALGSTLFGKQIL